MKVDESDLVKEKDRSEVEPEEVPEELEEKRARGRPRSKTEPEITIEEEVIKAPESKPELVPELAPEPEAEVVPEPILTAPAYRKHLPAPDLVVADPKMVFDFPRAPLYNYVEVEELPDENRGLFLSRLANCLKPGGVCSIPEAQVILDVAPLYFSIEGRHAGKLILRKA